MKFHVKFHVESTTFENSFAGIQLSPGPNEILLHRSASLAFAVQR